MGKNDCKKKKIKKNVIGFDSDELIKAPMVEKVDHAVPRFANGC
jgi:hypothetical protein